LLQSTFGSLRKGASSKATIVVLATLNTCDEKGARRGGKRKAILEPHYQVYLLKK